MAEYMGDDQSVALQQGLRDRASAISANPILANGGRILNVLDPEAYGWDAIQSDVARHGMIALTMVDRDRTLERLKAVFDDGVSFPYWEAFIGDPDAVAAACSQVLSGTALPEGWHVESEVTPSDVVIGAAQSLNMACGVAPMPAYILRGDDMPSMLTSIRTKTGEMVACASATMRYHRDGPLAGYMFAGGVSVSPDHRRMGLGAFVNAALLRDSLAAFGWTAVLEQAKADNAASVGMITTCGLRQSDGQVTVVINPGGGYVTR